jgi:hypothetical protein
MIVRYHSYILQLTPTNTVIRSCSSPSLSVTSRFYKPRIFVPTFKRGRLNQITQVRGSPWHLELRWFLW